MNIEFNTCISNDDLTEEVIKGHYEASCSGVYRCPGDHYAAAPGITLSGERVEDFSVMCSLGGRQIDLTPHLKEAVADAILNRMLRAGRRLSEAAPAAPSFAS